MNREELKNILPHREDMLLLDECKKVLDNVSVGSYKVRGDEFFLRGHFPGNPVVPGVILCEIMAQNACVLLADKNPGLTPYFTGLDKVKFKNKVLPNDKLDIECELTKKKHPFYFAKGNIHVNGKLCAKCEFSFALI